MASEASRAHIIRVNVIRPFSSPHVHLRHRFPPPEHELRPRLDGQAPFTRARAPGQCFPHPLDGNNSNCTTLTTCSVLGILFTALQPLQGDRSRCSARARSPCPMRWRTCLGHPSEVPGDGAAGRPLLAPLRRTGRPTPLPPRPAAPHSGSRGGGSRVLGWTGAVRSSQDTGQSPEGCKRRIWALSSRFVDVPQSAR